MIAININGTPSTISAQGLNTLAELVELIKASIDPDHMITGLLVNGADLQENDWQSSTNKFETSVLEVETGTPEAFVADRMGRAAGVVNSCYVEFRDARKSFRDGDTMGGNRKLITAVNTAKAFFEWYATLVELLPEKSRPAFDISKQVSEISEICKRICQQQLYQSWWALSESLEKDLEPKLDSLEDFCRKFASLV